jgi:hypothetical protein
VSGLRVGIIGRGLIAAKRAAVGDTGAHARRDTAMQEAEVPR